MRETRAEMLETKRQEKIVKERLDFFAFWRLCASKKKELRANTQRVRRGGFDFKSHIGTPVFLMCLCGFSSSLKDERFELLRFVQGIVGSN